MLKRSNRHNCQRGGAVLETALALPLLILMVIGTADFARVFYAAIVVEGAARAGVQYGTVSVGKAGESSGVIEAGQSDASGQGLTGLVVTSRTFCGCNSGNAEVSCSKGTCSTGVPSGYVEAKATYTFKPAIGWPGVPGNVVIGTSAKMRAQ